MLRIDLQHYYSERASRRKHRWVEQRVGKRKACSFTGKGSSEVETQEHQNKFRATDVEEVVVCQVQGHGNDVEV